MFDSFSRSLSKQPQVISGCGVVVVVVTVVVTDSEVVEVVDVVVIQWGLQIRDSSVLTKSDQIREFLPYFCEFSPFLAFLPFDIGSNKGIFPYSEFPYLESPLYFFSLFSRRENPGVTKVTPLNR